MMDPFTFIGENPVLFLAWACFVALAIFLIGALNDRP